MENSVLHIRPFKKEDKKAVIDLWFKCDLVVPWNNPERDIARKLKVNPELFLVGVIGDKVIASVMAGYEGHRGWINYLAVDPDFRGRRYGRKMMEKAEKLLQSLGCPKVQLQVREWNQSVIRFYENLGYKNDNVVSLGKRLEEDPPYAGE